MLSGLINDEIHNISAFRGTDFHTVELPTFIGNLPEKCCHLLDESGQLIVAISDLLMSGEAMIEYVAELDRQFRTNDDVREVIQLLRARWDNEDLQDVDDFPYERVAEEGPQLLSA